MPGPHRSHARRGWRRHYLQVVIGTLAHLIFERPRPLEGEHLIRLLDDSYSMSTVAVGLQPINALSERHVLLDDLNR